MLGNRSTSNASHLVPYDVFGWRDIRELAEVLKPLDDSGAVFVPFSLHERPSRQKSLIAFVEPPGGPRADGSLPEQAPLSRTSHVRSVPVAEPRVWELNDARDADTATEMAHRVLESIRDPLLASDPNTWAQLWLFQHPERETADNNTAQFLLCLLSNASLPDVPSAPGGPSLRSSRLTASELFQRASATGMAARKRSAASDTGTEPLSVGHVRLSEHDAFLFEEPRDSAYAKPQYWYLADNSRFGRFIQGRVLRKQSEILARLREDQGMTPAIRDFLRRVLDRRARAAMAGAVAGDDLMAYSASLGGARLSPDEVSRISWMFRNCFDQDNQSRLSIHEFLKKPLGDWLAEAPTSESQRKADSAANQEGDRVE